MYRQHIPKHHLKLGKRTRVELTSSALVLLAAPAASPLAMEVQLASKYAVPTSEPVPTPLEGCIFGRKEPGFAS